MIGLPNPYAVLGGIALLASATAGAFLEGKHVARGEVAQEKLTALSDALADAKAKGLRINELDAERQQLENLRQAAVREIYHETSRIIERPVYKATCVDGDGISLLDRAADVASGHPAAPDAQPVRLNSPPATGPGSSPPAH